MGTIKIPAFNKYRVAGAYHWRGINSSLANRLMGGYSLTLMARYRVILDAIQGRRRRVLEIGCGDGALCHLLAKAGHEALGLDLDEEGIRLAQLESSRQAYPIRPAFACVDAAGHADQTGFDYVVLADVIEHVNDPDNTIKTARRLLRPGGRLLMTTPFRKEAGKWDPCHVFEYTDTDLRALLDRHACDFEVRTFHSYFLHQIYSRRMARKAFNLLGYLWNPFLELVPGSRPVMLFASAALHKDGG